MNKIEELEMFKKVGFSKTNCGYNDWLGKLFETIFKKQSNNDWNQKAIDAIKELFVLIHKNLSELSDNELKNFGITFILNNTIIEILKDIFNEEKKFLFYYALIKDIKLEYIKYIQKQNTKVSKKDKLIYCIEKSFNTIECESLKFHYLLEKNKYTDEYIKLFNNFYSPIISININYKITNFNILALKYFKTLKKQIPFNKLSNKNNSVTQIYKNIIQFAESQLKETNFEDYFETDMGTNFLKIYLRKFFGAKNKYIGTLIILDDLTERKNMEKYLKIAKANAEEADKLKTAFLANMSHEIRTPMNAIIGFSDLLLNDTIDEKDRKEYLKLIHKSGNNLLKIIDDILDIAKIESKQLKIKPVDYKVHDILDELFLVFEELISRNQEKKIQLFFKYDKPDEDLIIFSDPDRIKQVFINLLSNAVKFTHNGFIEYGYKSIDNNYMYFYVKDSGIGIPLDKQALIFERFSQIEEMYTKEYGGTGLGLTISKNIINLLGGNIWVDSVQNDGSLFYFVLPKKLTKDIKIPNKPKIKFSQKTFSYDWSNFVILIAEDDEINFTYLSEILKPTNATILWAKNGLEAINCVEINPHINLVLMDIKMPELNGIEAIKYIKIIRPNLPVIVQTAFVMQEDKDICLNTGCSDYISKPIKRQKLFDKIEKFLCLENQYVPQIK